MLYLDPLWIALAILPLLLSIFAQFKVSSTYKRYSKIANQRGITGLEAVKQLLNYLGLDNIHINIIAGHMSDYYDPKNKVLTLSQGTANSASIAAIGIAAHELGHAQQDRDNYGFMRLRASLVPIANLGTKLGYILFFVGFLLSMTGLVYLGIALFAMTTLFSIVTLPVEFNASKRAMLMIRETGVLTEEEQKGAKAVLSAAALTYLAAALQSIMNLLYYIIRSQR